MAKNGKLVGPMETNTPGLGGDKVASLPPAAPKDPLGLIKR